MQKLKFTFVPMENPFLESTTSYEKWAEISLAYGEEILLYVHWKIEDLFEMFNEIKEYLATEIFPFETFKYRGSIGESVDALFAEVTEIDDEDEQDKHLETICSYAGNHFLYIRGTRHRHFHIGLISENVGEISYRECGEIGDRNFAPDTESGIYHAYKFDMNEFLQDTQKKINEFLVRVDA